VAARPTIHDLETAVRTLATLHKRGLGCWSQGHFTALTRGHVAGAELLRFCERAALVQRADASWHLTEHGSVALNDLSLGDRSRFGRAFLLTGAYDEQLAALLDAGTVTAGALHVPLSRLSRTAPTAGAILAWTAAYRRASNLVLPLREIEDLLAVTAMEQTAEVPDWVSDKQTIGWRAELYSLRLERARHGALQVLHVSRDVGDGFGYDIEDTTAEPSRLIEVKGSRAALVTFVLTARELRSAREQPERYEIQFWGEMALSRDPRREFDLLCDRGYPVVLRDVAMSIDDGAWPARPDTWRVAASASLPQDSDG
jgi:hypothetical protein